MDRADREPPVGTVDVERILVGYDDTPAARGALDWATAYAVRNDGELLVAYVLSSAFEWELAAIQINPDPMRHEFERRLRDEWTQVPRSAGVPYQTRLLTGRAAEALLRSAERERATLIAVGMTGRGTLAELMLGSTTHHLLQHAARPIVAVPATWRSSSPSDRPD